MGTDAGTKAGSRIPAAFATCPGAWCSPSAGTRGVGCAAEPWLSPFWAPVRHASIALLRTQPQSDLWACGLGPCHSGKLWSITFQTHSVLEIQFLPVFIGTELCQSPYCRSSFSRSYSTWVLLFLTGTDVTSQPKVPHATGLCGLPPLGAGPTQGQLPLRSPQEPALLWCDSVPVLFRVPVLLFPGANLPACLELCLKKLLMQKLPLLSPQLRNQGQVRGTSAANDE